jgi:hypothetical protein
VRSAAATLLLVFGASACSLGGDASVEQTDEGLQVLIGPDTDSGMDAITGGMLVDVGGCVGALQGEVAYVVVWPHGTSGTSLGVSVDDAELSLGTTFEGSGGYLDPDMDVGFPDIPGECREASGSPREVMWVQSIDVDAVFN